MALGRTGKYWRMGLSYVQNAQVRDGPETMIILIIFPIGLLLTLYDTVKILKCIKVTFQWNLFLLLFQSRNMQLPPGVGIHPSVSEGPQCGVKRHSQTLRVSYTKSIDWLSTSSLYPLATRNMPGG